MTVMCQEFSPILLGRRKSFCSSTANIPSRFELMFSKMSFTKSMNNNSELGSPCFRPMYELKNSEKVFLYLMHSLTVEYMDFIALTSLQLTCSDTCKLQLLCF